MAACSAFGNASFGAIGSFHGRVDVVESEVGVRKREIRRDPNRLLEVLPGLLERRRIKLARVVVPFEICLVGLGVDLFLRRQAGFLGGGQLRADLLRDRAGNLTLEREDVLQVALVTFAPDALLAFGADELRGDTDLIPGAPDRALHDGVDAESLRRSREGFPSSP